jgi:uncharacterized membrane protein HdeD (DUF308 family)
MEEPMFESHATATPSLAEALGRLGDRWGMIAAFGVIMLLLGLVALGLVVSATIASVLVIGAFMIATGILEIVLGFSAQTWGRFFIWIVAGLLYVAAGVVAISQPLLAASIFTLMLGAGLLATGIVRIVLAFQLPPEESKWLVLISGVITLLVGLAIIEGWPNNSFFILGIFLAIDLMFYGVGWISFGLALRSRREVSRAGITSQTR